MNKRVLMHNRKRISILLALTGGLLDAYTFIYRGGVFANAQTGNMVLLAINFAEGNFAKILYYLLPILAFVAGIFFSEYFSVKEGERIYRRWRHFIILIEIILCFIIGFIPNTFPDLYINSLVSFIASLQVNSFRKVRDLVYSNAFCTGNLRSATQRFVGFIINHDKVELKRCFTYLIVIISFIIGASIGAKMVDLIAAKAIWIVIIPLFIVLFELEYDYKMDKELL